MYKVSANINDVGIVEVPLTPDFDLRIPEVRDEWNVASPPLVSLPCMFTF
jgi:histidinol-phosphate/aromatic aminotransferase/cobyric acid decarboxylase-like protein